MFRISLKKAWKLLTGKRAVSPAISNVILVGAVLVVSFVVLSWVQYRSSTYQKEYSEIINADIAKLKERLSFEYVFYNISARNLKVYLMNCGTIGNVTIKTVYIFTNVHFNVFSNITLWHFNDTKILDQDLDQGEEGYFAISMLNLIVGNTYKIRVVTGRGSTFDYVFTP